MPPEPEEIREFLSDKDSHAYGKLVDRLLESPRYGERWGRHWLDIVGYADSEGGKLSADVPRLHAYRYRDYVIRSFNADKPYNRFLLEQIAGDELLDYENATVITEEINDNLIATGFLRMGPDSTSEREVFSVADRVDVVADQIDILSSALLGLTIKCARCHSHKYDPLPQRDYYRLTAVFKGAYDEFDWITPVTKESYGIKYTGRYLPYVRPDAKPFQLLQEEQERELHNHDIQKQIEDVQKDLKETTEARKKKIVEQKLAALPPDLHAELRAMLATSPEQRSEVQKDLAGRYEAGLKVEDHELKTLDAEYRKHAQAVERRIKLLEVKLIPKPKIRALWDRGVPSPTCMMPRGDPSRSVRSHRRPNPLRSEPTLARRKQDRTPTGLRPVVGST